MSDRSDETGRTPETPGSGDPTAPPPVDPKADAEIGGAVAAEQPSAPNAGAPEPRHWPDPPPEIPYTGHGSEAEAESKPKATAEPAATQPVPAADPRPAGAEAAADATAALAAAHGAGTESLAEPEPTDSAVPSGPAELDATRDFPVVSPPPTEAFAAAPPAHAAEPAAPAVHATEPAAAPDATRVHSDAYGAGAAETHPTHVLPAAYGNGGSAVSDRPNGRPFLTARRLGARGRQGSIFTDVDLTAGLGQVVAVCGDSGDGRTSLLLALSGRFATQHGSLEVDGQTRPGQIRRRFTVAQAGPPIRFDEYHTVAACIKETTAVSKGAATRANINAWLDRLAVDLDTGDTFGFLPRIEQIRFAIACAAACRTPGVVVDDADTGLDLNGSERVFEALRTVADAGQLVIAACTRSDPPADTVVDLRCQGHGPGRRRPERSTVRRRSARTRTVANGGDGSATGTADTAGGTDTGSDATGATRRPRRHDARNGGLQ